MTRGFPGGTAVSRLKVYDWPTADGKAGGSPHLHTASAEGYVVLDGVGVLETLSSAGYAEHDLKSGTVLWFDPGTVHRLVNVSGDLEILVVMQNAGLPEAGDAVFTFPSDVLADRVRYLEAAALPADAAPDAAAQAARKRRDLAVEGYLTLRERITAGDDGVLAELHDAAAALVRDRVADWREVWEHRSLAQATATGVHLEALQTGDPAYLATAAVRAGDGPVPRFGMCGHLLTWDLQSP